MKNTFIYNAELIRIVDGDTYLMDLDLGFNLRLTKHVRLFGLDTPELSKKNSKKVATELVDLITKVCTYNSNRKIVVMSKELDMYGRILGEIQWTDKKITDVNGRIIRYDPVEKPFSLNSFLLNCDLARINKGEKRKAWTDEQLKKVQSNIDRLKLEYK